MDILTKPLEPGKHAFNCPGLGLAEEIDHAVLCRKGVTTAAAFFRNANASARVSMHGLDNEEDIAERALSVMDECAEH